MSGTTHKFFTHPRLLQLWISILILDPISPPDLVCNLCRVLQQTYYIYMEQKFRRRCSGFQFAVVSLTPKLLELSLPGILASHGFEHCDYPIPANPLQTLSPIRGKPGSTPNWWVGRFGGQLSRRFCKHSQNSAWQNHNSQKHRVQSKESF